MIDTRDPNPEQFPERIWLLRTIPADPDAAGEVCPRWLDAPLADTERYECREYRPERVVVPTINWPYWICPQCGNGYHITLGYPKYCPDCGAILNFLSGATP